MRGLSGFALKVAGLRCWVCDKFFAVYFYVRTATGDSLFQSFSGVSTGAVLLLIGIVDHVVEGHGIMSTQNSVWAGDSPWMPTII